jgi:hypothetical protein
MVSIQPTTYDELVTAIGNERVAAVAAVVVPNLDSDGRLAILPGDSDDPVDSHYAPPVDDTTLQHFRSTATPIVPGSRVYRVRADTTHTPSSKIRIRAVPHGTVWYPFELSTVRIIRPADPVEYDFDVPYRTLDEFGAGSPYYSFARRADSDFDRRPHLPV